MNESSNSNFLYLRIIDAAANRACEALRVLEDFVRFVQDDAFLVEKLKTLRHRFVQNVLKFPMPKRLAFRETQTDVGTQISTQTEFTRSSLQAVLDANFSRLQESLRSLEEFSKLTQPEAAHTFEQIRYSTYTIQRVVFFTLFDTTPRRQKLRKAQVIQKIEMEPASSVSLAAETILAQAVQMDSPSEAHTETSAALFLLPKMETQSAFHSISVKLEEIRSASDSLLIVSDLPLAECTWADGVLLEYAVPNADKHSSQGLNEAETHSFPESQTETVRSARNRLGLEKLIGASVQSISQAESALMEGIDFLAVPASVPESAQTFQLLSRRTTLPVFQI